MVQVHVGQFSDTWRAQESGPPWIGPIDMLISIPQEPTLSTRTQLRSPGFDYRQQSDPVRWRPARPSMDDCQIP